MTGRYAVSILILGNPVMCDTIEAASPAAARAIWEAKFWSEPENFAAAIPGMDALNRECAEKMLVHIKACRDDARKWGITVTARQSRAKVAA